METGWNLYARAFRARWWVIVLTVISALAAARVFTARETPLYRAMASSAVVPAVQVKEPTDLLRSLETLERRTLVATFALLAGSRAVREEAVTKLGLSSDDVREYKVSASVAPNTNVIRIHVEGADASLASDLANAVALVTSARASGMYRMFTLQPLDSSLPAQSPASPNSKRNALVALIIGAFLGLAGAVGLEMFSPVTARANHRSADRTALAA